METERFWQKLHTISKKMNLVTHAWLACEQQTEKKKLKTMNGLHNIPILPLSRFQFSIEFSYFEEFPVFFFFHFTHLNSIGHSSGIFGTFSLFTKYTKQKLFFLIRFFFVLLNWNSIPIEQFFVSIFDFCLFFS